MILPSRRRTAPAIFAAAVSISTGAWAEPSKEDVDRADALFREAQIAMQKGQISEACAKFAESQKLDPANGTMLNLAVCHEKEGKYGSAYKELQELLGTLATSKNPDDRERARLANDRLRVVEKKVSRVTFDVSLLPSDATLTLDDEKVADTATAVIVDPGSHTVEATAPGKKPAKKSFAVSEPGTTTVKLDALEDVAPRPEPAAPAPPAPEKDEAAAPSFWTGQRVLGVGLVGVGLVGIGVGSFFGLDTFEKRDARDPHCRGTICDAEGMRLHDQATSSATTSTIAFGAGAAALVVGTILFVSGGPKTADTGRTPALRGVAVGPRGLVLQGAF